MYNKGSLQQDIARLGDLWINPTLILKALCRFFSDFLKGSRFQKSRQKVRWPPLTLQVQVVVNPATMMTRRTPQWFAPPEVAGFYFYDIFINMEKVLIQFGYSFFDYIEISKYFFSQNFLRKILIVYFKIISYFLKNRKFDIYLRIGTLYLGLKNMEKSKEYYDKSMFMADNNDKQTRVLVFLGNFYFETSSYETSIENYEKALNITRYKTTILSNLAYAYEALGENEKALKYADESINTSKKESDLGHTIFPEENVKELITRLRKTTEKNSVV
ncbi:MAG: tetratricopeptide repeat protein [Patescibacteria group bacterium]|nr:tetratricopeptide repeat protein [Patescibacteria group bacterium]